MMLILLGRLVQIQLIATESFTDKHINLIERSVTQRTQAVVVDDGRGHFIDRNGEELGEERYPALIVFPFLQTKNEILEQVAHMIGVSQREIKKQIQDSRSKPLIFQQGEKPYKLTKEQMEKVNRSDILGIVATEMKMKQTPNIAEHLIGVAGENEKEFEKRYGEIKQFASKTPIGISGLQQSFDEFLVADGEAKLLYHVDRQGEPIFGKRVKYTSPANPFYPVTVQTTIEKTLQKKAEEVVQKYKLKKGGLLLLDVKTNEIVAMVSKPSVQMNDNQSYKQRLENQMLTPHFPGSVFKTVIAAAAIDYDLVYPHRMFDCDTDPYGENKAEIMMGKRTFTESFVRSCNRTFAVLGNELMKRDKGVIETYTEALGAGKTVGWKGTVFHTSSFKQLPEEKESVVWKDKENSRSQKAIAQTAIGQKDVRLSPLAIANMMATIARGGEKKEIKAVKEIRYKNGTTLYRFEDHTLAGKRVSYRTVKKIQGLLRKVVTMEHGTGISFQSLPLSVAGKSGTAQTGKENRVNRWFAGYFPYENPRYALVVVDIETNSEQNIVTPIFKEFVQDIAQWENDMK